MAGDVVVKQLFEHVVGLTPTERSSYLDVHCDDPDVRSTIERLLAEHDAGGGRSSSDAETVPLGAPRLRPRLPERLGRFELRGRIGHGGMGEVYRAHDPALRRDVALKVLPRGALSDRTRRRFLNEGWTQGRLRHPGIVTVHEADDADGIHYIVMELLPGGSLADRLRPLRALDARERGRATGADGYVRTQVEIVARVTDALHHAHLDDVLHRDVKPSNVLLDAKGRPHLADFGIAKDLREEEPITNSGAFAPGTYAYMSPEQVVGASSGLDAQTDVFSVGVVLYELLTGTLPFRGDDVKSLLDAIVTAEPRPIRQINPAVPRDLATVVHKAIEKPKRHRYQTAAHLAGDLRSFLEHGWVSVRGPGVARRARRWVIRHRAASIAAAFVFTFGLLAGGIAYEVDRRRDELCPVTLTADVPAALVHARRFDETTHRLGPTTLLGATPLEGLRLEPGQYRFTVVAPNGDFAELTEMLDRPGEPIRLDARILPAAAVVADMILVPAGRYDYGDDADTAVAVARARRIELPAFHLDRTEVSNAAYRAFVEATGARPPYGWRLSGYDEARADLPVVGVTWREAQAYARWAGKRLPTMFEWEAAARAPDGRRLPWGDGPGPEMPRPTPRAYEGLLSHDPPLHFALYAEWAEPVTEHAEPATPLGFIHMLGNVQELVDNVLFDRQQARAVKGGFWAESGAYADLTQLGSQIPGRPSIRTGFRCARSAAPAVSDSFLPESDP